MLTRIIHQSPQLVTFFENPKLPLIEPQKRHLINLADGIPVTEGRKTLANIQRQEESLSEEHAVAWLEAACRMAIQLGEVEPVLGHFLRLFRLPSHIPP